MPTGPQVTVCVSTRNRGHLLRRLVACLEAQTLGPRAFEVVIVDDGSTDGSWQLLQELAAGSTLDLTVLRNESSRGPAAGRNRAWRLGTGPVCAFTDDDCQPLPHWLEAGLAAVAHGEVHAAGAVRAAPEDEGRIGPFSRFLVVNQHNARWFAAANLFVRRAALEAVGGFDERYRVAAGEDTELGVRLQEHGSRLVFAEHALVHHDVTTTTVGQLIADQRRWADIVGVFASHPAARREFLHHGVFWKRTHPRFLLLVLGLLTRRPGVALAASLPWLHERTCVDSRTDIGPERWTSLPGTLAIDAAEVAAMLRGSIRYRTPVL